MSKLNRRVLLKSAIGSALALPFPGLVGAQELTGSSNPRRIDVHHHFAPPAWVANVKDRPLLNMANTRWKPEHSIDDMDAGGVAASIISITNPGISFGDAAETRRLARACNDYGAKLVSDHPSRFGLFAAMPLPDVDDTLHEIEYAYDTLHADGVGLITSYGDRWLGNPDFRPVMEELNRRKAVVFVHPTAANCCRNLDYAPGVRPGTIEYGTDTTRAIAGIAFSGDARRYPDIRFIWSHAGGTAPFLLRRLESAGRRSPEALPDGFTAEMGKYFYDTASAYNRGALLALMEMVATTQIVFGTDFPPGETSTRMAEVLAETGLFSASDMRLINRENALELFPRFS
ncbi:MAG: amidohydrolase family protein [Woeseiaceae bacterium]|nr:amidohydrolase family protein [Woeseiaceae bacterium]